MADIPMTKHLPNYALTVPMKYVDILEKKHPILANTKLTMQLAIIVTNKVTLNKRTNQNWRTPTKPSVTSQQCNTQTRVMTPFFYAFSLKKSKVKIPKESNNIPAQMSASSSKGIN